MTETSTQALAMHSSGFSALPAGPATPAASPSLLAPTRLVLLALAASAWLVIHMFLSYQSAPEHQDYARGGANTTQPRPGPPVLQLAINDTDSNKASHRGPDARDAAAFAQNQWPALASAVADVSWLLSKSYPPAATLKLVGDRYHLTQRQRTAVMRCSCEDAAIPRRQRKQVASASLQGARLLVDGFNVVTILESALSGAVILLGRDGCVRDLAGMHGNYRTVSETLPALLMVQQELAALGVAQVLWLFDRPVSNSGRIRSLLLAASASLHTAMSTDVELLNDPDPVLASSHDIIATSDSEVLDKCEGRWFNLAKYLLDRRVPNANILPLG
eukprot:g75777.t1